MKILILDDDCELLEMLERMLKEADHEVDCSASAQQAVEMVAGASYDFVLVDYKMPENDGIWFMRNAKLPRTTRALLMTALVNRDVISKMFALGAVGYIIKPFTEEDLLRHLQFYTTHKAGEIPMDIGVLHK